MSSTSPPHRHIKHPPPTAALAQPGRSTYLKSSVCSLHHACTRSYGLLPIALLCLGYMTGAVIVHLHMQHHITHYLSLPGCGINWFPMIASFSALLVGLLYVLADFYAADSPGRTNHKRTTVILRCVGALMGINYAVSKLPQIPLLLSSTLFMLVVAVYYMIDRTRSGLIISLSVAVIGTLVCPCLTSWGYLGFVRPDMAGNIQSWVPVILLASAVCIGSAARVILRFVIHLATSCCFFRAF